MVDRVDRRVDALEALNFLADRQRVVEQRLQVRAGRVVVHLGEDPGPVQRVSLADVVVAVMIPFLLVRLSITHLHTPALMKKRLCTPEHTTLEQHHLNGNTKRCLRYGFSAI